MFFLSRLFLLAASCQKTARTARRALVLGGFTHPKSGSLLQQPGGGWGQILHLQQSRGQVSSPLQRNSSVSQKPPRVISSSFLREPTAKKCHQVTCWSSPAWAEGTFRGMGLGGITWDHACSPGRCQEKPPRGILQHSPEPQHSPGSSTVLHAG